MKSSKWNTFDRLANAIRIAEQRGAIVKWNSRIDGHRFDALVRSNYANQEFLIVVDIINDSAPVTALRVKTFARKVEGASAHMGILATLSNRQQEAFEETAECSVLILDRATIAEMSDESLTGLFRVVLHSYEFGFVVKGIQGLLAIPEEPALLRALMREIEIKGPNIESTPERLSMEATRKLAHSAVLKPQRHEITFPPNTLLIHPNTGGRTPITAFVFTYRLIPQCELTTTEGIDHDPYLVEFTLKGELAKRNPAADYSKIESGFETVMRPSKYYYNPNLQFSYYCESVKKGKATIVLIESYQNGDLLQARITIAREFFKQFVEITDRGEIERLKRVYDKYSVSDKNLEGRFKVFLSEFKGAECIDDLALTPEQKEANKADYFFDDRRIISELKALYTDTAPKIDAILTPYKKTPEWPLFFGKQDLHKVISHLPDSDQINSRMIRAITDSIEGVVEKANRQIRATKETFGLPDAGGLLVILNDAIDILSPELVTYRIRKSLNKRTPEGHLRFPHVSVALLISGAHYTQMTPTLKGMPILIMPNAVPEAESVVGFVGNLNKKWAAFSGLPLFPVEIERLSKLSFGKFSEDTKRSGPLTVQDSWREQYQRNPYLRSYGEEQLLEFGHRAFEDLSTRFVKGAPKTPKEEMLPLIIRWSNFLDEVSHRGLDLKVFTAKLGGLREKMEALYQQYQDEDLG